MKVLVTGGAGYVGSVLVAELLARSHEVRVVDRLFWGEPDFATRPGVEVVNGDVRLLQAKALDGIDAVDHLAGFSKRSHRGIQPERQLGDQRAGH